MRRIIEDLSDALKSELEASVGREPYVDDRLDGGDFIDPSIAEKLCKSACMVLVFTPMYFDEARPYCTREFKAMVKLEETRLQALEASERQHSLIIPVVFRGLNSLPTEIKSGRICYDFSSFSLADRRLSRHPRYAPEIRRIADYITARYTALSRLDDPCRDCTSFSLPTEQEILGWLRGVVRPSSPFPMRGANS
jgi:hypothetical protein